MFLRNILLAAGGVFVIAGVGLFVVLLGEFRGRQTVAERPAVSQPANPAPAAILTAAHAIPRGTLLREDDFRWKEAGPEEVRPGNLLRGQVSAAEFFGAISRHDFKEGEALAASEFVKPGEKQFLAAVLKPGHRAIAISIDAAQIGAGLILPGDHVDVLLTQSIGSDASDARRNTAAETVIRNARVVAIDQSLSPEPALPAPPNVLGSAPRVPKTVTIELADRQAEMLLVAEQLGKIALAVRPLEGAGVASGEEPRAGQPVWASEVSVAFRMAARRPGGDTKVLLPQACDAKASVTGSTVECSVRRPPSPAYENATPGAVRVLKSLAANGQGANQRHVAPGYLTSGSVASMGGLP